MAVDPQSFKLPGENIINGIIYIGPTSEDTYKKVQQIQFDKDDIIVASFPKTGTTLLQEMVDLVRHKGNSEERQRQLSFVRVPYLEINPAHDPDWLDKVFHALPHPRTVKTHFSADVVQDALLVQKVPCIYVMRNPKDALVSYYHFYRMNEVLGLFQGSWNDFFEMIMEDGIAYGNIIDHYLSWWRHRQLENMLYLRYEDLVGQPKVEIKKIAKFCGVDLTEEIVGKIAQVTSFASMKKNPQTNFTGIPALHTEISPFMRKGVPGDSAAYFTNEQSCRFDRMMKQKLEKEPGLLKFLALG